VLTTKPFPLIMIHNRMHTTKTVFRSLISILVTETKSVSRKCNLRNILLKLFIHLFGTSGPRKRKSMNVLRILIIAACPPYGWTNVIQFSIRLPCKLQKRRTTLTTILDQNRLLKLNSSEQRNYFRIWSENLIMMRPPSPRQHEPTELFSSGSLREASQICLWSLPFN
jgi:hypothetical protein